MNERFDTAHREWLAHHLARRGGERLRRLEKGHQFGEKLFLEKVWWPMQGHFRHLHPEFEIVDFMGNRRFIDAAFLRPPVKLAFEVDGFGPHWRDMSRKDFADQWVRHMQLLMDGWLVVRISRDDLTDRPRLWQQMIMQLLAMFFNEGERNNELTPEEKAICKLALRLERPMKLKDVERLLSCTYRTARSRVARLQQLDWLIPASRGAERIHAWFLNPEKKGAARFLAI